MNKYEREIKLADVIVRWFKDWKIWLLCIAVCVCAMFLLALNKDKELKRADTVIVSEKDDEEVLLDSLSIEEKKELLTVQEWDEIYLALTYRKILNEARDADGIYSDDPWKAHYFNNARVYYRDIVKAFTKCQVDVWNSLSDSNIIDDEEKIEESEIGKSKQGLSRKDFLKYFLVGFAAGVAVSLGIAFIKVMNSKTLISADDVSGMFNIMPVGSGNVNATLKAMKDKSFFNKLLIVTTFSNAKLEFLNDLQKTIEIEVCSQNDYVEHMAQYDGILLVVKSDCTKYQDLKDIVGKCELLKNSILGYYAE